MTHPKGKRVKKFGSFKKKDKKSKSRSRKRSSKRRTSGASKKQSPPTARQLQLAAQITKAGGKVGFGGETGARAIDKGIRAQVGQGSATPTPQQTTPTAATPESLSLGDRFKRAGERFLEQADPSRPTQDDPTREALGLLTAPIGGIATVTKGGARITAAATKTLANQATKQQIRALINTFQQKGLAREFVGYSKNAVDDAASAVLTKTGNKILNAKTAGLVGNWIKNKAINLAKTPGAQIIAIWGAHELWGIKAWGKNVQSDALESWFWTMDAAMKLGEETGDYSLAEEMAEGQEAAIELYDNGQSAFPGVDVITGSRSAGDAMKERMRIQQEMLKFEQSGGAALTQAAESEERLKLQLSNIEASGDLLAKQALERELIKVANDAKRAKLQDDRYQTYRTQKNKEKAEDIEHMQIVWNLQDKRNADEADRWALILKNREEWYAEQARLRDATAPSQLGFGFLG